MTDNYKIVAIGDSETGKTSLLGRYINGTYYPTTVTIGAEYNCKTHYVKVDGGEIGIRLQLWDTAGQERYATVVTQFYRGCDGVLAVFDVSRPETFRHLADQWIPRVQSVSPNTPIIVIGNKTDAIGDDQLAGAIGQAKRYCRDNGFLFVCCSAKTGSGIQNCFDELANTVYHNRPTSSQDPTENTVTLPSNSNSTAAPHRIYRYNSYCCKSV